MKAWWSGTIADFRASSPSQIIGQLTTRLVASHTINRATQLRSWQTQVVLLGDSLVDAPDNWRLLLESPMLRLGKRIDAILLTENIIFVIEFKVDNSNFDKADREQTEDYALDLFDFHSASHKKIIVPILVVPAARSRPLQWPLFSDPVTDVLEGTMGSLREIISGCVGRVPNMLTSVDIDLWEAAPYRPVPTIIAAAQMLYAKHGVEEIAATRADVGNLTRTTNAILATIAESKTRAQHTILFVTGIPGAGKTLCGLNTVFGTNSHSSFLTGNLPLVHVIRAALERDARAQGRSARIARQETESAIQPLMGFLRDNLPRKEAPHEHVVVFDEAQRAWDADFGRRKFGHAESEAALFLDIMRRHPDWAVIVALVGNGQEINTGEAGLMAWGEALSHRSEWRILAAPGVLTSTDRRQRLFSTAPPNLTVDQDLHLAVPVRSIRSSFAASWVEAVLDGDANRAKTIALEAGEIPFQVTRSLSTLRTTLRRHTRGTRRAGLVCSAGARRLQADGIWPNFPHLDADAMAHWFLGRWPDVRASDALEIPATQFACQGLELDYVGLCWGNDLIRRDSYQHWVARKFSGTRWQERRKEADIAYQINTYRVLLTRARYNTVIWVPQGDSEDITRSPAEFDAISCFLQSCGASLLVEPAPVVKSDARDILI